MAKPKAQAVITLNLPQPPAGADPQVARWCADTNKELARFVAQLNQVLAPGYTPPPKSGS